MFKIFVDSHPPSSDQGKARRTPSISAATNYVYKCVYIYFSADGQARAVVISKQSGDLMVYKPLKDPLTPSISAPRKLCLQASLHLLYGSWAGEGSRVT